MPADDLDAPLGQRANKKPRFALPVTAAQLTAGVLGACLSVFAGWALFANDPLGGEPTITASAGAPASHLKTQIGGYQLRNLPRIAAGRASFLPEKFPPIKISDEEGLRVSAYAAADWRPMTRTTATRVRAVCLDH